MYNRVGHSTSTNQNSNFKLCTALLRAFLVGCQPTVLLQNVTLQIGFRNKKNS